MVRTKVSGKRSRRAAAKKLLDQLPVEQRQRLLRVSKLTKKQRQQPVFKWNTKSSVVARRAPCLLDDHPPSPFKTIPQEIHLPSPSRRQAFLPMSPLTSTPNLPFPRRLHSLSSACADLPVEGGAKSSAVQRLVVEDSKPKARKKPRITLAGLKKGSKNYRHPDEEEEEDNFEWKDAPAFASKYFPSPQEDQASGAVLPDKARLETTSHTANVQLPSTHGFLAGCDDEIATIQLSLASSHDFSFDDDANEKAPVQYSQWKGQRPSFWNPSSWNPSSNDDDKVLVQPFQVKPSYWNPSSNDDDKSSVQTQPFQLEARRVTFSSKSAAATTRAFISSSSCTGSDAASSSDDDDDESVVKPFVKAEIPRKCAEAVAKFKPSVIPKNGHASFGVFSILGDACFDLSDDMKKEAVVESGRTSKRRVTMDGKQAFGELFSSETNSFSPQTQDMSPSY